MVVLNDLCSAGEVIRPLVRVVTAMPSDGNCCRPRARALHVQCQLWWGAAGAQSSILLHQHLTHGRVHPEWNSAFRMGSSVGFNHRVYVCVCYKSPFVTQNTRASTCKSKFLSDQMEKICLISLYNPSILLREHAKYLL